MSELTDIAESFSGAQWVVDHHVASEMQRPRCTLCDTWWPCDLVGLAATVVTQAAAIARLTEAAHTLITDAWNHPTGQDGAYYVDANDLSALEAALAAAPQPADDGRGTGDEDEYRQDCPNGCLSYLFASAQGDQVPMYCGVNGCDVESPGRSYRIV